MQADAPGVVYIVTLLGQRLNEADILIMPVAGGVILVTSKRAVVVDAIYEENPDRLALAREHFFGVNVTTTQIDETANNADHFVKLFRPLPGDSEGRDGSRTGSGDRPHVRVSRDIVALRQGG